MTLLKIEEPRLTGVAGLGDDPIWRLGFRPFYLLAAAFAMVSVPLWIARYFGRAEMLPNVNLAWHMHEMIFGFAIAVIIGFLYTAAYNWTGLWTPRRGHLAALAMLWVAGRLAMLFTAPIAAAAIDILFLPLAAWPLYRVLKRAGNKRNMFLVGLLGLLTFINILFHCSVLGWIDIAPVRAIEAAILIVVTIETVIGGRVIPMFTRNAVPGVQPVIHAGRDRICIALTVLAGLAWCFVPGAPVPAALAIAAACSQLVRVIGWKPHRTLKSPLLWILHLSYAWIPFGLFLMALAALGLISSSAAFHVLAVGSMGGLMIGMMTRTALGHTGRPLAAGRGEVLMYVLVQTGVVARFGAAINFMGIREAALLAAALCWSLAFLLYVVVYGPYLIHSRVDGRDG